MRKYSLLILIIVVFSASSCKKKAGESEKIKSFLKADTIARIFLDSISAPNEKNEKIWQLDNFKIFGNGFVFSDSTFPSDTMIKIQYKTWVEGVNFSFKHEKQFRKLWVTITGRDNHYKVVDFNFQEIKKLSFGRQFLNFLCFTVLAYLTILFFPFILKIYIGMFIIGLVLKIFPEERQPGCLMVILTIIFDLVASYYLYTSFNSVGAIIIGIVPCTIFIAIIIAQFLKE